MLQHIFRQLRSAFQSSFIAVADEEPRAEPESSPLDHAKYIQREFPQIFELLQGKQNEYTNAHKGRSHPRELYRQLQRLHVDCEWVDNSCIASGGGKSFHIRGTTNGLNGHRARAICKDKSETKRILSESGFRVPRGYVYPHDKMPAETEIPFSFPIVLKPVDGSQGIGVNTNIASYEDVKNYWQTVPDGKNVLMEEFITGIDLRCSVVDGKLIAAASRVNAHVFGDGVNTIAELIRKKEEIRTGNPDTYGEKLVVDPPRDMNSVPRAGEMIILNPLMNMASGGDSVNVTPFLSAEVRQVIEDAASCIEGANYLGVDILTQSFSDPSKLVFIELNSSASFMMHKFPCYGKPIEVGEIVARYMKKRLLSDPLPRETIKVIAEKYKEHPDVQKLVWEIDRLRSEEPTSGIDGTTPLEKTGAAELLQERAASQSQ